MLLSTTVISLFISGALSKSAAYTPRTYAQIRQFILSPIENCPNTIFDSGNGNCKTDLPIINVCSDGVTYCDSNQMCGTWAGVAGCCREYFDSDKSSTPGDPTSNTSCKAYEQQLSNFNFTPQSHGIYPSSTFCNFQLFPSAIIVVGGFSSGYNISVDNTGQVCCPNYFDVVVQTTPTGLNQTEALCVPWFVKDGQTNSSDSSATGSATSSSASSTSTQSGAMSLTTTGLALSSTIFSACAVAFLYIIF